MLDLLLQDAYVKSLHHLCNPCHTVRGMAEMLGNSVAGW
jgi:hypothetical protein